MAKNSFAQVVSFELLPRDCTWDEVAPILRYLQYKCSRILNQRISDIYAHANQRMMFKDVHDRWPENGEVNEVMTEAEFHKLYPEVGSYIFTQLVNETRKKWKNDRNEVLIRKTKSLPSYRKDYPLCTRNTGVRLNLEENKDNPTETQAVKLALFSIVPSITFNFRF